VILERVAPLFEPSFSMALTTDMPSPMTSPKTWQGECRQSTAVSRAALWVASADWDGYARRACR
jgi:hypothetical protein